MFIYIFIPYSMIYFRLIIIFLTNMCPVFLYNLYKRQIYVCFIQVYFYQGSVTKFTTFRCLFSISLDLILRNPQRSHRTLKKRYILQKIKKKTRYIETYTIVKVVAHVLWLKNCRNYKRHSFC